MEVLEHSRQALEEQQVHLELHRLRERQARMEISIEGGQEEEEEARL